MPVKRFFVGGNWKCQGTQESVQRLVRMLSEEVEFDPKRTEVVVAPPFVFLEQVRKALPVKISVSAQNCYWEPQGAFTGEISGPMLKDLGVQYVILGHSERRQIFHETDEMVSKKIKHALSSGLQVIACVGELLSERDAGQAQHIVHRQIGAILAAFQEWTSTESFSNLLIIAYEPVWAIGTGQTATLEQVQEMHHMIRQQLSSQLSEDEGGQTRIIYGGSVNENNCIALATQPDVDGFLVGGASLKQEFLKIIQAR